MNILLSDIPDMIKKFPEDIVPKEEKVKMLTRLLSSCLHIKPTFDFNNETLRRIKIIPFKKTLK